MRCFLCYGCTLIWLALLAAIASEAWFTFDPSYAIVAAVVLVPVLLVMLRREGEDLYFKVQGWVNEIWYWRWKMRERRRSSSERRYG